MLNPRQISNLNYKDTLTAINGIKYLMLAISARKQSFYNKINLTFDTDQYFSLNVFDQQTNLSNEKT